MSDWSSFVNLTHTHGYFIWSAGSEIKETCEEDNNAMVYIFILQKKTPVTVSNDQGHGRGRIVVAGAGAQKKSAIILSTLFVTWQIDKRQTSDNCCLWAAHRLKSSDRMMNRGELKCISQLSFLVQHANIMINYLEWSSKVWIVDSCELTPQSWLLTWSTTTGTCFALASTPPQQI